MEQIREELLCPILMDLLQDPIMMPCCNRAASRLAVRQFFDMNPNPRCPCCNTDQPNFDPMTAPRNIILANLVEQFRNPVEAVIQDDPNIPQNKWSATLVPITSTRQKIFELTLNLENSTFEVKPSLFIAVVDRSGSMSGAPWKQVETALIHIMALTHNNPSVRTIIIGYNSSAAIIDTTGTLAEAQDAIRHAFTGGGTMFTSAFEKVKAVLDSQAARDVSSITVAFMTDGQAGDNYDGLLPSKFKDILRGYENISVHTVGFSGSCDRNLLEKMRECGAIPGTFRFAEPQDDGDTLCQKLQGLFEVASKSSSIPLVLNGEEIRFAINSEGRGVFKKWVHEELSQINVNGTVLPVELRTSNTTEVNDKYIDYLLDGIASTLLEIGSVPTDASQRSFNIGSKSCLLISTSTSADIKRLRLCFVQKKLENFLVSTSSEVLKIRINYLSEQADQLIQGASVNLGKLSDMRFTSQFGGSITGTKTIQSNDAQSEVKRIAQEARWKETRLPCYSCNNENKGRNPLQEAICSSLCNKVIPEIQQLLDQTSIADIEHTDADGNNTIMLCAYCGQSEVLQYILDKYPNVELNHTNPDGESAMTIAIKKRGFWKIIKMLHKLDVGIPENRREALQEYAYDNEYKITGEFLANIGADFRTVNDKMTPEYIRFAYESAKSKGLQINVEEYLVVCLKKLMMDIIQEIIEQKLGDITFQQFLDYTIPPKPDHPETAEYLKMTRYVMQLHPEYLTLTGTTGDTEGNTCLGVAINRGSLPHVQYFVDLGADLEFRNNEGDSPLRLACVKKYPCIMKYLLEKGCDITATNLEGNNVLFPICKGGNKKMFDMLVSYGADVDHISIGGDAPLLRACRYGKADVLEAILEYTSLIDYKAPIDGFSAIFSATESDRSDCIEILHRFGVGVNQQTDDDNLILKRASPLHLAAYYNRLSAAQTLLNLGANINAVDFNGQTALHIAVIQGHTDMIKLLRNTEIVEDNDGCTPHAYCRNHKDIRKLLVDPLLDVLMQVARGQFCVQDVNKACEILRENKDIDMDISDYDKTTPLFQAVLHSNYPVVEALLEVGCDKTRKNQHGVSCGEFGSYIKNNRINKLLGVASNMNSLPPWLFLGSRPNDILNLAESGVGQRMTFGIQRMKVCSSEIEGASNGKEEMEEKSEDTKKTDMIVSQLRSRVNGENFIWNAKLFAVSKLIQGTQLLKEISNIEDIFKLCLLTNNAVLFPEPQVYPHIDISWLPLCTSEVYTGIEKIDRTMFRVGCEVRIDGFLSASTMWRVALEHLPSFNTANKKGTAFIIKSKTGRFVREYSQFSFDNEVLFKDARFKVTNWYQGNVICFAQENIRESTYKLTDAQIEKMLDDTRLIIELVEM